MFDITYNRDGKTFTRRFAANDRDGALDAFRAWLDYADTADGVEIVSVTPVVVASLLSCRQTRRGDWIVCQAVPATLDIGIERVGNPADGYTTGHIFSRHAGEDEARRAAEALAVQKGWAFAPDWKHPRRNGQFSELPKKYPTRTTGYSSFDEAREDGWIHINPSKTIQHYRGRVIYCADITQPPSSGYDLAVSCAGIVYLESTEVWAMGERGFSNFSPRFRTGDLVDAIQAARRWIDDDLITQAEAARIAGITTQAVHNATRDGRLDTYADDSATNPRHGGRLVSRQQVLKVWAE